MSDLDGLIAGYGSLPWLIVLVALLFLLMMHLRLRAQVARMQRHYHRLVRNGGGTLEEVLERHLDQVEGMSERVDEIDRLCEEIERRLEGAVQRVGLVRFNPFSDTGGDQSFSIALLDGRGDGIVISSLFSRSETRVFAKPIQAGQSKYNLTAEEEEAIQLAHGARPAAPLR
ncbi:MAG TPA: DUF4446 family protein [Chloroflexota bacterium]|nr:DUF4446 family protein [Chloroflexota bacterium]